MIKGIIIYSDTLGKENYINWHIEKLAKKGIELRLCPLNKIDYSNPPDFAIMRAIAPNISERLENLGVRVFNRARVAALANNKTKTYELMQQNKIEIMKIYKNIDEAIAYPVVVKSNAGHGGTEVFWARDKIELKKYITLLKDDCLIQAPCSDLGKDLRVYAIGGKIIAAMLRTSKTDFRSNFCLGGTAEVYTLSKSEEDLINRILALVPADYIGVDFIFDKGKIIFNEIEDVVGSRMIYTYTDIDIVQLFVDYIEGELKLI